MPLVSFLVPSPPALLLWLGACAGHTALMVYWLNYLYGFAFPRPLLRAARRLNYLLVFAGPVFFWLALGLDRHRDIDLGWSGIPQALIAAYTLLCWLVGFVLAPLATLR